jgi:hypothetical protein
MTFAVIYFIGVVIGLTVMREPWTARVGTALAWPLGPAAFIVVVAVLLVASLVVWPLPVLVLAAITAVLAWWLT